ncbi:MAG: hypothetical protein EVB11_05205 [Winogradskyella sp.]|nr:MAG: hypothetical protein EVB11_05205 [Winogradskyella sp.]
MQKLLLICAILFSITLLGQHDDNGEKEHIKHTDEKPGFEAVLSGLFIRNTEESITDFATELHLTYWTTHKWAFGVGYTIVFEEDSEIGHELAGLISHKPYKFLTVNVGPSFSLPNSHKDLELSAYVETEWAFEIGEFHAGPTLGALVGEEFRYFGGFHLSYEF